MPAPSTTTRVPMGPPVSRANGAPPGALRGTGVGAAVGLKGFKARRIPRPVSPGKRTPTAGDDALHREFQGDAGRALGEDGHRHGTLGPDDSADTDAGPHHVAMADLDERRAEENLERPGALAADGERPLGNRRRVRRLDRVPHPHPEDGVGCEGRSVCATHRAAQDALAGRGTRLGKRRRRCTGKGHQHHRRHETKSHGVTHPSFRRHVKA